MARHRAYVQDQAGAELGLRDVETPTATSGEVLVDVLATPLLSYTKAVVNGMFPLVYPLTLGVSAIGRISAVGPDCTTLKSGQLVYCDPMIRGRDNPGAAILHGWMGGFSSEPRKLMEGPWRNGAWAEKMLVPTENLVALPEERMLGELGYTIPQLCWINAFSVPFGGWLAADLKPGATAIVAPATGHFGAAAVQVALAMGASKVVAAGRNKEALDRLRALDNLGRVQTVQLSGTVEADTTALRNAAGGPGADAYLDFSPFQAGGATHPTACIGALKERGIAVLMGGIQEDISLNYAQLMMRNITVRGNFMYPPGALGQLASFIASGQLDLKVLSTKVFGFEELQEGIEVAESNGGAMRLTVMS